MQFSAANFSGVLEQLKSRGYILECRREATCIYCFDWNQYILPGSFVVDESYFFHQPGNPDEERMLYAITLSHGGKAYLVDSCHVYADNISVEMARKLEVQY